MAVATGRLLAGRPALRQDFYEDLVLFLLPGLLCAKWFTLSPPISKWDQDINRYELHEAKVCSAPVGDES